MTHLGTQFPGNETFPAEMPEDVVKAAETAYYGYLESVQDLDPTAGDFRLMAIEAFSKAILAERQRNPWQPIETAPVGTQMIGYEPMYGWLLVSKQADGTFCQKSSGNYWDEVPSGVKFTHWMPLQSGPKGGAA